MAQGSFAIGSVVTIVDNGSPDNRVDLAILGDGYTSGEMGKYQSDVQEIIQHFFSEEPFVEYQNYINVHQVEVISNESGADHPELFPPVFRDTAFNATYNCAQNVVLICVNTSSVIDVLSSTLEPSKRDITLVVVNDSQYGGSGGSPAVASTNQLSAELALHELGHSFGLLADEYGGPPPPACNISVEPFEVNATRQIARSRIKWNHWIELSTPVPTVATDPAVPGLFEGGKYCDFGLFRPTHNSKMRSLEQPFEQINAEQLIRRIYNFVSPLDDSNPSTPTVTILEGQTQVFQVVLPQPLTHNLNARWFVDGQSQGTNLELTVSAAAIGPGVHTVEVIVEDPTVMVRSDPTELLTARRSWEVTVTSNGGGTILVANLMNGNDDTFNSRVYLWNPSTSPGNVTVRVFTLPVTGGAAQELTATPLDLGTLGARSALNVKLAEDILTPLGIPTPYTSDGGNLTLEFTIGAADVRGAAQVFSSSFAFGTYPLQEIQ